MSEAPTLPQLTLLPPLPLERPQEPEVPAASPLSPTFRQDLTNQVDRITKLALDRLESAIGALKPYELTLAAGILLDKRKDLEVTRAPASVHNTIVVNGLTRADALRFLTDGAQPELTPSPGTAPTASKSAPKGPARAPRPLPRQAAQPINPQPKKGFTIMAHPIEPGPQNSGVFLPAGSRLSSSASAPGDSLSNTGARSPEDLRASGAVLQAGALVSSERTDQGQAVSAEQAKVSELRPPGSIWNRAEGSGSGGEKAGVGSALSGLAAQAKANGDQDGAHGDRLTDTPALLPAHPGAEAPAATGLTEQAITQGTSKEGLT